MLLQFGLVCNTTGVENLNYIKEELKKTNNNFQRKYCGVIVLFLIFCFMYSLNSMTPLLSDDYFNSFVWPEGMRLNGLLPEDTKKVSSLSDVFASLKAYYFVWGGRIPGQAFMILFVWWGKEWFNIINSMMTVLLIMELYWITHEGIVSFKFDYKKVFWLFFALWSFNVAFVDTFMWLAGSCDYLWLMVLLLAFLLPYVQNFYNPNKHKEKNILFAFGMFVLGVIAGCSREMLICWIIVILLYWLFLCKKADNLQSWKIFGFLGLCIGYAILIFAPGNFARLAADAHTDSVFAPNFNLMLYKICFIIVIAFFHFFLWYFIFKFFTIQKDLKSIIEKRSLSAYKNIVLAKLSFLIALGTMLLMLLIVYAGARPTFATLVFLVISAALLFRASEVSGIDIIRQNAKSFFKILGIVYFVLTASVSFYWNYANSKQWNNFVQAIEIATHNDSNAVIEILPMPYPPQKEQLGPYVISEVFLGMSAGSWYGAHVIEMPVFYENYYYNIIIPQYYGFKGKIKQR